MARRKGHHWLPGEFGGLLVQLPAKSKDPVRNV
jgi:hypothetical protein